MLLKLLQEASTLGINSLKKEMLKDKRISAIFKKNLSLDDIEDKEAFLATLKYWVLNNDSVKNFVASRQNVKDVDLETFAGYRKMRGKDLTQDNLKWLSEFIQDIFKEYSSVDRGVMSAGLKKELRDWFNASGRYYNLPSWAQRELMSIPSIRPKKRIIVYRGLLFSEGSLEERKRYDGTLEVGNGLEFLRSIKKGTREVDLKWDRPSSWSHDKAVAERFAKYGPASSNFAATFQWLDREMSKKHIDGALGFVIATFARPEDILIDTDLMRSQLETTYGSEGEVILKAGTYSARIVKKYTVSQGEVNPDEDTETEVGAIGEILTKTKQFVDKFELPENYEVLSLPNQKIWSSDAVEVLKDKSALKKLITNSATTSIIHSYDKLNDFYNNVLKNAEADLDPTKVALNEKLRKKAKALRDFSKNFSPNIRGSKVLSKSKIHELTGQERRSMISSLDLKQIENDLIKFGKLEGSGSSRPFAAMAKYLGVDLPSSAKLHMFGSAKQEPIINEVVSSFFKSIGVDKPDDPLEAKKQMINFIRKAHRNVVLLNEVIGAYKYLKEATNE